MKIGNHAIKLDPALIQVSPSKKEYKVVMVEKDLTKPPKWVGKAEKHYWIVTVKYVETGDRDQFTFDYADQCIKKEKVA